MSRAGRTLASPLAAAITLLILACGGKESPVVCDGKTCNDGEVCVTRCGAGGSPAPYCPLPDAQGNCDSSHTKTPPHTGLCLTGPAVDANADFGCAPKSNATSTCGPATGTCPFGVGAYPNCC